MDTTISIKAGIISAGILVMSIRAPIETKKIAPNMSLSGVVKTRVTE